MKPLGLCIVALAVGMGGCGPTPEGNGGGAGATATQLKDLPIKVDWQIPSETVCTLPKPDNIGCTTLCKPCRTFICRDGEWVANDVEPPDFVCDREIPGFGDDITACPRQSGIVFFAADSDQGDIPGFCPAECSFCY